MTQEYDGQGPDVPDIDDPFGDEQLDQAFETSEAPEMDYDDLPDGKYTVFVYSARELKISNGKRTGWPGIGWQLRVISGQHRGFKQGHSRFFHASDAQSMGWLKKDLAGMGIDLQALGLTLSKFMKEGLCNCLDRVLEIQVKRTPNKNDPNNPYVNVYINRQLPGMDIPEDLRASDVPAATGSGSGSGASRQSGGSKPGTATGNVRF